MFFCFFSVFFCFVFSNIIVLGETFLFYFIFEIILNSLLTVKIHVFSGSLNSDVPATVYLHKLQGSLCDTTISNYELISELLMFILFLFFNFKPEYFDITYPSKKNINVVLLHKISTIYKYVYK